MIELIDRSGKRLAGPVGFEVQLTEDGHLAVTDIVTSQWQKPDLYIHLYVLLTHLSVSLGGIFLFIFLRKDPNNLFKKQILIASCTLVFTIIIATDRAVSGSYSSWAVEWLSYELDVSAISLQRVLSASNHLLGLVSSVIWTLVFLEVARRVPRKTMQKTPHLFTLRRALQEFLKLQINQIVFIVIFLNLFFFLYLAYRTPIFIAALVSASASIIIMTSYSTWRIRREAIEVLSEDHPIVRAFIRKLADAGHNPQIKEVYLISREKWPLPNAFVIGVWPKQTIVGVTEPLLENFGAEEVMAVLFHEYGHYSEKHTTIFAAFWALIIPLYIIFAVNLDKWLESFLSNEVVLGFLSSWLKSLGFLLSGILFLMLMRWLERRADLFAKRLGYGAALGDALAKIADITGQPSKLPRWIEWLSTHPSADRRKESLS